MDMENWVGIVFAILALGLAVIGVAATNNHRTLTQNFIEAGYTRTTLPGSDYVNWVKPCGE